jgi:hypothetical protein
MASNQQKRIIAHRGTGTCLETTSQPSRWQRVWDAIG